MIKKNKVITLNYRLKDGDSKGTLIEETYGNKPLVFLYATGGMLPKFEENISGLKQGDKFEFIIEAKEAYGEISEQSIIEVSKAAFNNDDSLVQLGKSLPMQDKDGNRFDGIIVEIKEESVMMDFNHPLAGVNLAFEGDVVEVRDATEHEIEHGHIHQDDHNTDGHECDGNCGNH
jgi:FKBP-type peptidyl-prolyl cis-trans isomerase SlyD